MNVINQKQIDHDADAAAASSSNHVNSNNHEGQGQDDTVMKQQRNRTTTQPLIRRQQSSSSSLPIYNLLLLYFDAIAYHLSLQYPRVCTKKNDTYFWMITIPTLLMIQLVYGISIHKSLWRIVPTL